jgi:mannose-6-phosphate isomerase-like protein (cupin superfamily)
MGYSFVDLEDLTGEGPGGRVRKVRRALGARAFGFNYYTLGANEDGREHDHSADPQEEVYFVVKGSGRMRIDDDEIELLPGRFVRVDAESRRLPISGDGGLEFVTFGAPIEDRYEPPEWG